MADFLLEPQEVEEDYIDPDRETIFGTKQRVSQREIDNDIINVVDDFTDKASFFEGLKTLPYTTIIERFESDDAYANTLMNRFKEVQKIPILSIVDGRLSADNNIVYTTVKNTALTPEDSVTIEAEMSFLNSIPQDIWDENTDAIQNVLREVEQTLADVNIDVVGLVENYHNREGIMKLLVAADVLSKDVSNATIKAFVEAHTELIETPNTIIARNLDQQYKNYNIVALHSNLSEASLFADHGLIKVADNMYHKVDQTADVNVVREAIYEGWLDGFINIPSEYLTTKGPKLPASKPSVLEDISKYLMSRPVDSSIANQELYSGYQVAFRHTPVEKTIEDVRGVHKITTDEQYLKSEFISNFYNYMLDEKVKRSDIYNNVLSKFNITDRDITLVGQLDSIDNIKYKKELEDYITIHRDTNMNHLVDRSNEEISEDVLYMNFPELKAEYEGPMIMQANYLIVPPTIDEFVKVNGEIYRKGMSKVDAELFVKISSPVSNVYYKGSLDFQFNKKKAKSTLDQFGMLDTDAVSSHAFEQTVANSRINDNMLPELKNLSTLKDKSYKVMEGYNSFVATKDGVAVGMLTYDVTKDGYTNPEITVNEMHRGKGVGTELYLNLFDRAWKNGRTVSEPKVESKQSLNIFSRIAEVKEPGIRKSIQNIENISSIFDSHLELLDLYTSKEETDINEELDCG